MNCETARQQTMAERYTAGRLSDAEKEEFEQHYFECDHCFAEVEALRALKLAMPGKIAVVPAAKRSTGGVWLWAIPIAAALLLSVYLIRRPSSPGPVQTPVIQPAPIAATPSPNYVALAHFDPPSWNLVRLRGGKTSAQAAFEKAMELYTAKNYPGCADALHSIRLTEASYYEGICLLLSGRTDAGRDALRHTIAAGDTPYVEEAHFYLAKAMLAGNNADGARNELKTVIGMRGDLEHAASDLLAGLK